GVALWSQSDQAARLAVLMEDGSMHLFSLRRTLAATVTAGPGGMPGIESAATAVVAPTAAPSQLRRASAGAAAVRMAPTSILMKQRAISQFPPDFFEHTVNLTSDPILAREVTFGGDALQQMPSEALFRALSPLTEEVLHCQSPVGAEGCSLDLRVVSRRRWVPVGLRLLLGHSQRPSGASSGPGPLSMKLAESGRRVQFWSADTLPAAPLGRRWFDAPLTAKEVQGFLGQATAALTLVFSAPGPFVIDALEVHAVPFSSLPRAMQALAPTEGTSIQAGPATSLLQCPAREVVRCWYGAAAPATPSCDGATSDQDGVALARSAVAASLRCLAALPGPSRTSAEAPAEVCRAVGMWRDPPLAEAASQALRGRAAASTELLLAVDTFLQSLEAQEETCHGGLPLVLLAVSAGWCREAGTRSPPCSGQDQTAHSEQSSACLAILRQRPDFSKQLGSSIRAALSQPRNLHLCPQAVLNSLAGAAMTASLLQIGLRLEDCFKSSDDAAQSTRRLPEETARLWKSFCHGDDNSSDLQTLSFLLTLPAVATRDFSLGTMLGFLGLSGLVSTAAAPPVQSEIQEGLLVDASDAEEDCEDDDDEDAAIPNAVVSAAVPPSATPARQPQTRPSADAGAVRGAECEAAAGTVDLLHMFLVAHLSSEMMLSDRPKSDNNKNKNKDRPSDMEAGSGLVRYSTLLEASQRLVLWCTEAGAAGQALSRHPELPRLVLAAKAEALAQLALQTALGVFAGVGAGEDAMEVDSEGCGAHMEASGKTAADLICSLSMLGGLLAAVQRAAVPSPPPAAESSSALPAPWSHYEAKALLVGFLPSAWALVPALLGVLRRCSGVRPASSQSSGAEGQASSPSLLEVSIDLPASHLQALLPAQWADACEAEGCHMLDRPAELLLVCVMSFLRVVLQLPRGTGEAAGAGGVQGAAAAALRDFAAELGRSEGLLGAELEVPPHEGSAASVSPAAAAHEYATVLTQLALNDGSSTSTVSTDEKALLSSVVSVIAADARDLLKELCCNPQPFHWLLDSACYAKVMASVRPHLAMLGSLDLSMKSNWFKAPSVQAFRPIAAFAEASAALWAVAKRRPKLWAEFARKTPEMLDVCLLMGQSLALKFGCTPLRQPEVVEQATLPYRLLALAFASGGAFGAWAERRCPAMVFRLTIEAALCAGAEDLRRSAAVALAIAWDELRSARDGGDSRASAVCGEVRCVVLRAVEALLPALGSRATELAGLAGHVLATGGEDSSATETAATTATTTATTITTTGTTATTTATTAITATAATDSTATAATTAAIQCLARHLHGLQGGWDTGCWFQPILRSDIE
ncbi:unnamed protein product, partial [Polarella glacialis]